VNEHLGNHSSPVDSNKVLDKAIRNLDRAVQESGARITHETLPVVIAEEIPITLLFQNLIAMPSSTGGQARLRRFMSPPKVRTEWFSFRWPIMASH